LATGGVAMGGGMIGEGGVGTGLSGSGTGGGGSTPGGMGSKQGGGGGRGGGSPYGVPGAFGGTPGMLPRRQLSNVEGVKNSGAGDGMISGELARRPVREKYRPAYEMDARVVLRFAVNAAGQVLDGIVVEISSGRPSFDNKVIEVLKKWLFVPLPAEQANVIQSGVITFIFRGE
jgi:TonB family protein